MSQTKAQLLDGKSAAIQFTSGSASAPSVSFTGDTNTGIYSPGADQVAISTNGTGRLFVDASGNISAGISPATILGKTVNVYGGSSEGASVVLQANSGSEFCTLFSGPTAADPFALISKSGFKFATASAADATGYSEKLRITSTGTVNIVGAGTGGVTQAVSFNGSAPVNSLVLTSAGLVGVGTSSPGALLSVASTTTSYTAESFNIGEPSFSTGRQLYMGYNTTDGVGFIQPVHWGTEYKPLVLCPSGGRVGIGTTAPSYALDVRTTGTSISSSFTSDQSEQYIALKDSGTTIGHVRLGSTSGSMLFFAGNGERGRFDSSGRLLVGTSSARLYTSLGYARFQVEGTAFADSSIGLTNNQATVDGSYLIFNKTRGTSVGSVTSVQSGDLLGSIWFQGSDGTSQVRGAVIEAVVDATPGVSDMPGRLVFSTTADGASSPTERMRITNDGNTMITSTAYTSARLGIGGYTNGDRFGVYMRPSADDATAFSFNNASGTSVGSITTTASATAFNTSSDYRLKENVTSVTDGIIRLQQLKPSRFNFIADPAKTVDGFIAHEVQSVVPEAISGEKDAVDDEGNPVYQGIDQSKMVPLLTAALQEAVAKIESLEARLTAAGI